MSLKYLILVLEDSKCCCCLVWNENKNNGKIKRKVLAEDKCRRYSSDMIILLMIMIMIILDKLEYITRVLPICNAQEDWRRTSGMARRDGDRRVAKQWAMLEDRRS